MQKTLTYILVAFLCVAVGFFASGVFFRVELNKLDKQYNTALNEYNTANTNIARTNSELRRLAQDREARDLERYRRLENITNIMAGLGNELSGIEHSAQLISEYARYIKEAISIIFGEGENIPD